MKSIQSKSTLEQIELTKLKQYFLGSSDEASKSVCVYSESGEDLSKIFSKHDRIEQIKEGSLVTFPTPTLASKAVSKRHGKKGRIVCLGFTPPLIALGHNPNIFVVRNLIEEITIPQLWAFLDADENLVSHISVLPTLNRDVIILCKDKEGQKQLLSKNRTKLGKWTIQIDLWWEFCASLMSGKELFVENLPEGTTFDSLKTLLGVGDDDLRFVQIDEVHQVSLIVCGSKDIKNKIAYHGPEELRFSLLPQLPSDNQVFLNNLHETTTELDVRNFMSGCGNVMKVVCWLDNRTGRKKARVIFEVSESSENALKLDGTVLKDLPVSVGPLTKPTGKPTAKSTTRNEVYIIATTCLRHLRALDLCLMFQDCGYIEDIKMPIIDKFMRSKPAVIRFRDAEAVQKALSKKLSPLRGVRLIVSQQEPKSKPKAKSFPHRRKHTPGKRSRTHTKREDEEPSPAKKNKVQHFDED